MKVYFLVYEIVQCVPQGRVLTYGSISRLLGGRLSSQGVGWAMKALPEKNTVDRPYYSGNVPWHRVINSRGGISTTAIGSIPAGMQQELLEAEGIEFNEGTIDLNKYLWIMPPDFLSRYSESEISSQRGSSKDSSR